MNEFPVKEISPSSYFSKPVYLDKEFILTVPQLPFSADLEKTLSKWGFNLVYSDGEPKDHYISDSIHTDTGSASGSHGTIGDQDKIQQAEQFYESFQKNVETLFTLAEKKGALNYTQAAESIKTACDFVRENHRYLMRVEHKAEPENSKDYLVVHSARSTVFTIIIGLAMKMPNHKLIELGVAALFHEIGMIKLPPQLYQGARPLTDQEKKLLSTHTILGCNLLKSMNFPLMICNAVLEHHERENGTGYPQKIKGNQISLYAKIIAVACSYEAILSKRPHKEAKDGYTGMLELLRNEGKQYDETVIRALVNSLSIYPIGLYVLLSSGKKGQVIDVVPENPRYPIVQIFGEVMPDGNNKVMRTSQDELYIVRPLAREEI
ncbi:MAG: HD-GYP domain-containing protein [Treponema sp.]|nr:HD-GYP domain-containing protein [Treponema sp.]